jgi:hypothetical protein
VSDRDTLSHFLPPIADGNFTPARADETEKPATRPDSAPSFTRGGRPGPGRKKGQQNRATIQVKTALHDAFVRLGGVPALVKWGRANPSEFYRVWVRIAPIDVNVTATTDFARELAEARRRVGPLQPEPIDVSPAKPALPAPDPEPEQ